MAHGEAARDDQWMSTLTVPDRLLYLKFDDLLVDLIAHRASRAGRVIELGPTEYRFLCFFLRHPSKVFTREELIHAVWPPKNVIDRRTVDVHIARLRRALNRHRRVDPIRTVRTIGYALG
jgi:two-component system phosphate regulon response regulator PhoB